MNKLTLNESLFIFQAIKIILVQFSYNVALLVEYQLILMCDLTFLSKLGPGVWAHSGQVLW